MDDEPTRAKVGWAYKAGIALVGLTCLLTIWTTIVRDDGNALGPFGVIMAVAVGAFATRFRADGAARTLVGVAVMQLAVGLLIATAPVTAATPDGVARTWIFTAVFTALWLSAAGLFRIAARADR